MFLCCLPGCQGYICRQCTKPVFGGCEKDMGWPLLCCEAFCCEGCAISGTRIYLQEERQIVTDPCDNRKVSTPCG